MSSGDGGDANQFVSMSKSSRAGSHRCEHRATPRCRNNRRSGQVIADPETDAEMKAMAQEEFKLRSGYPAEKNLQISLAAI